MKLVDFFTAEGKKALQQMIFLGKFVCIDKNTVNDDNWKSNYGYTKNIPFLFIQNTTIFPESLQKIFSNSAIFPCGVKKQQNSEKLSGYQKGNTYAYDILNEQFVLYQFKFVRDILEIKILEILSFDFHEDTYVFPVGKYLNSALQTAPFVERLEEYVFPAYPAIFGVPAVFYAGNRIYAVQQDFVIHLPIEDQIQQILFKNDQVAVIQFEAGFLLYESDETIKKENIHKEPDALVLYQTEDQKSEALFFERLQSDLKAESIDISDADLLYFHAAVKSGPFTLLKGRDSYTHRKLCTAYAHALGIYSSENLFYLYPKNSWGNMYDLLLEQIPAHEFVFYQYPNLMTFLARANEHSDQLFLCVVENLNLARPEYYLQQFLSILQRDKSEKILRYKNPLHQFGTFLEDLPIGDNIIFIGTLLDSEIGYPLTSACFNEMRVAELSSPNSFVQIEEKISSEYMAEVESVLVHRMSYHKWKKTVDPYSFFTKNELQFFDSVNLLFCDGLTKYKISSQTLMQMAEIMVNGMFSQLAHEIMPREKWLDRILYMHIVHKLSGVHPSFQKLLGTMQGQKWIKGELIQLLESDYGQKISDFSWSVDKIKEKVRSFEDEGFFY